MAKPTFDGQIGMNAHLATQNLPIQALFPEAMECLFRPKRFKVLWGGRGAGRSWGIARFLLLEGKRRCIRVLCVRELQNSIAESVHKVLSDQIEALGLAGHYEIQQAKIIGSNGTTFSFEGIKNNSTKIKSYEGIDYAWVEEAVHVSRTSWGILIPTIRKPGSEIIMSFNPELKTDYTYTRFVLNPDLKEVLQLPSGNKVMEDARSVVVKMTHYDNPWFPDVLQQEMEADKKRDYDYYLNVWGGFCRETLEGVVYAKQLRDAQNEGRIRRVPWQREVPVDTFWDLGRADHTAIWFGQRVATEFRVLRFLDSQGEDITYYIKELKSLPYVYGTHWLPHDAKHQKLVYKHSIEKILRDALGEVRVLPRMPLADGVNSGRLFMSQCWFDEGLCGDGLDLMRRYKYKVKDGQYSQEPDHGDNGASDAADAFRYMAQAQGFGKAKGRAAALAEVMGLTKRPDPLPVDRPGRNSSLGWMG